MTIKNKRQLITVYSTVIIIALAVSGYFLFPSSTKINPPQEFRLNVTHVSDLDESLKYSDKRVGGNCHLASTTMMLKSLDPAIEFWQVLVARGTATSFSFYFPNDNESEIKGGIDGQGTAMALKAIRNMGYQPHVRVRALPLLSQNNWWVQVANEVGGDAQTYWLTPPMDEYKTVIASGIPLVAAGTPCWSDYNVVEGYTQDTLFVVVPDPDDQGKTDSKMSCPLGSGLQNEVFWATPLDKQIRHQDILADMQSYAQDAPDKMLMYADNLERGSSIVNFEIEKLYLARLLAAKYLEDRGYKELALGYKKSASLLINLTKFAPSDANKHIVEIIQVIRDVANNEKSLLSKWSKLTLS